MMIKMYSFVTAAGLSLMLQGCQESFLDTKPRTELLTPSTLTDVELLLNNSGSLDQSQTLGELSADDYYLTFDYWQSLNPVERNAYVWAPDIYEGTDTWQDWNNAYTQVFYANLALESLLEITQTSANHQQWKQLKGWALFLRAYAYHNLSQVFVPMFDEIHQDEPIGLPLKYSTSLDEPLKRSTMRETYDRIITDLQEATDLLLPNYRMSDPGIPTRPAAYAALSRVNLSMGRYDAAQQYADSCLRLHRELLNYGNLNKASINPFPLLNPEVLYSSKMNPSVSVLLSSSTNRRVDTLLYDAYDEKDLRKQLFFRLSNGFPVTKFGYCATLYSFTGLTTAEMYLNRAEGTARSGDWEKATADLNTLLGNRFSPDNFVSLNVSSAEAALALVLSERRKELCFRGLRWTDLRRLNQEGAGIVLIRELNGQSYRLSPTSNRYTFPIPINAIMNTNIIQHERATD